MELNGTNEKVACGILELLKENNCTIKQATDILDFVQRYIKANSTVQFDKEEYETEYVNLLS